ncbi:uncharacterized protein RJT20DRAFT_129593 [Scheffersomyces xylosifermentans]|uniref:uncharacterized protein n=1 Tax=Scheffersomyces xylosifermentans TaxID=1304137 RepID=UPI00315DD634
MVDYKTLPVYKVNATEPTRASIIKRTIVFVLSVIALFFGAASFLNEWGVGKEVQGKVSVPVSEIFGAFTSPEGPKDPDSLCPLVEKLDPSKYSYNKHTLHKILHDNKFKKESRKKLLGAVRVPTEVYDDMLNPNSTHKVRELFRLEPRWKPFSQFHKYLRKTFPLVHKHLKVEKINKFALVYTWKGTTDKKPIFLAAHQDVVPVQKETIDQWTYPPFKGGYDGEYLYGRGVSDCKNLLIGLLETIELLLKEREFKPERTIILGFGYDEESAGTGAGEIAKHLLKRYGPDSIAQIIDEGNGAYETVEGVNFVLPATGEKGYLDSLIELKTPGGHSSVPPDHTSIGILAQLISKIEDVQFESILTNSNPVLGQLQCIAEHSRYVSKDLKQDILKAHLNPESNKKVIGYLDKSGGKYLVTTSQAVDIIFGGAKSNALPEFASVLVDHRIAIEESVSVVSEKVLGQIKEVAEKFGLGIIYDGQELIAPTAKGYFNYTLVEPLEPAPITPINDATWNLFGGALRYLYEDLVNPGKNETFVVAPYISTGNTDTKSYWDLTRHIYRYEPGLPSKESHIHSVDERLLFDGHFTIIAFYYYYLQVVDKLGDEFFAS